MEIQKISTLLLECVQTDDIVGARRLLEGVNEEDMKSIVAKRDNCNGPLFVAAMRGNVDMVQFLSKECHADKEELGKYNYSSLGLLNIDRLVTPLFCAAVSNKLEVVKLLIDLGADINTSPDTGGTPVLYACVGMNINRVKYLILHGADVKKPNNYGYTCLMFAIHRAIDSHFYNDDNYQDIEDIVLLLIDHGADPYMKIYLDYDAFQMASHFGLETILQKLLLKIQPPARYWMESYELLGIYYIHYNNEKAFSYWKEAVEMRGMNSCDYDIRLQPNAVYLFAKEVDTVEELETLFQNREFVRMHALMLSERILGPNHITIQWELFSCSRMYTRDREFRRGFEILRYAYQQQNARGEQMTRRYIRLRYTRPLYELRFLFHEVSECHQPNSRDNCLIHFEDVFEVLQMATSKINDETGIIYSEKFQNDTDCPLSFMKSLIYLMKFMTEMDKDDDGKLRFNKVIYRLVRCQPKTGKGQTLFHLSVEQLSMLDIDENFYWQLSSIAVVELLLECGANVNAVDDEHNTALHLCSKALRDLEMLQHLDTIKQIAVLLLKHCAHPDMVNHSGDSGINGLTSNLIEMNIQDLVSLKCLAASAVVKNVIPYVGQIPSELESFVQMHGICASNENLPD